MNGKISFALHTSLWPVPCTISVGPSRSSPLYYSGSSRLLLQGRHIQPSGLPYAEHGGGGVLSNEWIAFVIAHGTLHFGVRLRSNPKPGLFGDGRRAAQIHVIDNDLLQNVVFLRRLDFGIGI